MYATDVLAFDLSEDKNYLAGDIVISVDAAVANATAYGTSVPQELALYIIHGILHLLGYDDHKKNDVQKMRREEKKLLSFIESKIPSIVVS